MSDKKLLRCKHCGNIITKIHDSNVPVICCGEPMEEMIANTVDAATEKHVPVVERAGHLDYVKVGEVSHPMSEEHRIEWIYVESEQGSQLKYLAPNDLPQASFNFIDDKPVVVYAYCNLHGLWKTEIK